MNKFLLMLALLAGFSLTACKGEKESAVEETGAAVEEGMDEMGESMEEMGDEAEEAMDEMGDEAEEATEEDSSY